MQKSFHTLLDKVSIHEKIRYNIGTNIGKIWYRKKVLEPVSDKFGKEKSKGMGIRNIWYRKKLQVSVSFKILLHSFVLETVLTILTYRVRMNPYSSSWGLQYILKVSEREEIHLRVVQNFLIQCLSCCKQRNPINFGSFVAINDDLCVFPARSAARQVAKFGFAWGAFSDNSLGNQQPTNLRLKQVFEPGG